MKKLISEQNIVDVARRGEKVLLVDEHVIVTDAARDRARQLGIEIQKRERENPAALPAAGAVATPGQKSGKPIAIGSDHGGYQMKEALKAFLETLGYPAVDVGTYSEDACDYPDYAYAVARMVSLGHAS